MKIIREGTFETNSSSSHSLVIKKSNLLKKEELENIDTYDFISKVFGRNLYDLIYSIETEWDDEGNIHLYFENYDIGEYDSEEYGVHFNFCRGEPRTYDDFIHKLIFLVAYYIWDEEEEINSLLDKVDEMLEKYVTTEIFKDSLHYEKLDFIINEIVKKYLRDPKIREEIISAEFDRSNSIIYTLVHDNDELLEKFLFNSQSYISISGDEYQCDYLKCVGSESDFYHMYGNADKAKQEFEKRIQEVYNPDEYQVERDI